ncbi:hypothetical protein TNCT_252401 [Trichonephila clavata]|uniref:Uncharacterized protein n=1 Tax=Trichonephila clavata TaxID=2740835 RepID=A0A8X6HEF8_TRICU|nr:hypothetical protein TNCT_252401 [Trichonephila clavata]
MGFSRVRMSVTLNILHTLSRRALKYEIQSGLTATLSVTHHPKAVCPMQSNGLGHHHLSNPWSLRQSNHQLCQYLFETHTHPPNHWIRIPLAYLLHVIGAHTTKYGPIKDSGTIPSAP